VVIGATMVGYISIPSGEVIQATTPHLVFMIVFPGVIALLGWNIGVSILSPINALLFINFVPVTTLLVSVFQGYDVTVFDLVGTVLIILSLLSNNLFVRLQKKESKRSVQTKLRQQVS
jgi:drug/metabolite transporter (DMT)-like permease